MLIAEILLATFELPAGLIDLIVLISMGNRTIALCCGGVIFTVLLFLMVVFLPKLKWQRILAFSPMKYVVVGALVISLAIYTELFNGSYSFDSGEEYSSFKQSFAKYDRHFWPTKYIKGTKDRGQDTITVYSIYPWDVEITDGRQFVYKVITFYSDEDGAFCYYPFTYNLYMGVEPSRVEYDKPAPVPAASVSDSDAADTASEEPDATDDNFEVFPDDAD
jgi:hypothetical protein